MYIYYKKDQYDIMEYNFDSITEFIDYLDNTLVNTNVWNLERLSSEKGDFEFCQTNSLEDAKNMCKYGLHEDFNKLVELKLTLEKYIKLSYQANKQYNYYVGYTPDVKAYLEGNPLSMFNRKSKERQHIDIYFNSSVLCDVSKTQIFNRGAITLSLVEILENMGFSVALNIFNMSYMYNQIHYAKFNLKKNGEKLNIQKLFFPLCHPSFLRRLIFRLQEETPDITRNWINGYGKTCDDYMIREILDLKDNDILIGQPYEMRINGKDIVDDANAMFYYINKWTNKNIELESIKKVKK